MKVRRNAGEIVNMNIIDFNKRNKFSHARICDPLYDVESVKNVWKPELYILQQEAPPPRVMPVETPIVRGKPDYYGVEYHGSLSAAETMRKLREEGHYLVRKSSGDNVPHYTLSLRFNKKVSHYRLYYDGRHYVKDNKKFESVRELVATGLVTLYIGLHAASYLSTMDRTLDYEASPHVTLNRSKRRITLPAIHPVRQADVKPVRHHSFKEHTFRGLNWCDRCGNFLWGFSAQGVKCEDCGFSAHTKCSETVPSDCFPDLKKLRGVFGIDLTTLVKAHGALRPYIVEKCVDEIERRGLDVEGLYRVSGFADEIERLKCALDKNGERTDLSPVSYDNIHVITGILKLYLRLLPLPLITYETHPPLIRAIQLSSEQDQIGDIKDALTLLPPAHYHTLKYLVEHLARVVLRENETKMNAINMATVFAPTLMPMLELTNGSLGNGCIPSMTNEISVVERIIQHHQVIFT